MMSLATLTVTNEDQAESGVGGRGREAGREVKAKEWERKKQNGRWKQKWGQTSEKSEERAR